MQNYKCIMICMQQVCVPRLSTKIVCMHAVWGRNHLHIRFVHKQKILPKNVVMHDLSFILYLLKSKKQEEYNYPS